MMVLAGPDHDEPARVVVLRRPGEDSQLAPRALVDEEPDTLPGVEATRLAMARHGRIPAHGAGELLTPLHLLQFGIPDQRFPSVMPARTRSGMSSTRSAIKAPAAFSILRLTTARSVSSRTIAAKWPKDAPAG